MTNEVVGYAVSPHVAPSRQMEFPYADAEAWMGYMCDAKNEWVFVQFSTPPNIANTEPADGFNHFSTRLKWGDEIKTTNLSQKWGADVISFRDGGRDALKRLTSGTVDTVLLELDWFGNGVVYFRFSLQDAAAAIAKAKTSCK